MYNQENKRRVFQLSQSITQPKHDKDDKTSTQTLFCFFFFLSKTFTKTLFLKYKKAQIIVLMGVSTKLLDL